MKGFGDLYKDKKKRDKKTKPFKEQIINQAFKLHSEGNIPEASKYYQYFITQGFKDYRVFSNYGSILQNIGKLQDAELSLRKAIEINPNYANAHYNLGVILNDLGKLQDAEKSYRKAIELNPNYANAYSNLGNVLRDLGNLQDAELSLRKAIELNPNYANAYSNLGNVLKDLGNLQDAELSLRKAIEVKPDYADAYSNLGNVLRDLGNLQDAELSLRKAIEINPNFAYAHYNLGNVLKDLGNLQDAEFSYRKAIELNPNFAYAHSNLGNVLRDLGNLQDAEKSYRKAIELNPNFAYAHSNLGNVLRDLGKLKELVLSSESTLESRSINQGYKLLALLDITIANFILGNFSETLLNLNRTNKSIKRGDLNFIKDNKNKKNALVYSQFITSLYPNLLKENNNQNSEIIPHIGESHCLSFAHQTVSISRQLKQIQPVLIMGGKAWHFANKTHNQWKDSLNQQIKKHAYSNKVLISFGEIDCRKDEGILNYAIKNNKVISEVCEKTIKGYLDYMEEMLSPNYSEKYY